MTAPMMGITQENQSCPRAQSPWKMATAVEHAGFTEVLVTGIETRWMSVRQRPMARGPNPAGASLSVAPQMTRRKMQVVTISVTAQARKP